MFTQISARVIELIQAQLMTQNEKGFNKYRETLDDVPFENYDWNQMVIEELIDGMQYLVKENLRLRHELKGNQEMRVSEFQEMCERTMPTPSYVGSEKVWSDPAKTNYAMGLAGESGELVDLVKKVLFHGHAFDRDKFIKEAGDVSHYLNGLCAMFGISMEEVNTVNYLKLLKRYPNGFNKNDSIKRVDMSTEEWLENRK
jgi:NTP pyrophosphatase (non-canonical NTP hydrolase)